MKKICTFILAVIISVSAMSLPAYAAWPDDGVSIANPQIVHSYTKTVTINYPKDSTDLGAIPTSIPYNEYDEGSWFRGTLSLQTITSNGNVWTAIYSGQLVGLI